MSDVTLSKAVRSNLLHLQNTAKMMDVTQERLATGKKVNSALDNPTNFFTAASLNARAADISTLLDAMSNGIQILEAADNGLKAITKNIESMQSTLRQARQDKTFQVASYSLGLPNPPAGTEALTFADGTLGAPFSVELTKSTEAATPARIAGGAFEPINLATGDSIAFTVTINGTDTAVLIDPDTIASHNAVTGQSIDPANISAQDMARLVNAQVGSQVASVSGGALVLASPTTGTSSTLEISGYAATLSGGATGLADTPETSGSAAGGLRAKTVDELVNEINAKTLANGDPNPLRTAVRATNDNGKLRIENLSTGVLAIDGVTPSGVIDGVPAGAPELRAEIDGNKGRANLAQSYNDLLTQLDGFSHDASLNGVNLLRGDVLKLVFNETGTSIIEIQTKNANGESRPIDGANLGLRHLDPADLDLDSDIDAHLERLQAALDEVRGQASNLGTHLSVVKNRENFTKEMINTLQTGAANLTLADSNEEAANMLALQTRQQLSQTALSLASQADQAVLRLFG